MLAGLFLLTHVSLLYQPRPGCPGVAPPRVAWVLSHQLAMKKMKQPSLPPPPHTHRHATGIIRGTIMLNNPQDTVSDSGAGHRGSGYYYYLYCSEAGMMYVTAT